MSRIALARLGLDRVWWLISPQNPLKPEADMAPLAARLAEARRIVGRDPRIVATDIEARLGTRYTADTLRALKRRFPGTRFVFLMGADNLAQLPRWRRWAEITRLVPLAVFHRPGFAAKALGGPAASRLRRARKSAQALADAAPPAWHYCRAINSTESATEIRARGAWVAKRKQERNAT